MNAPRQKMKIRRGDTVRVLRGKDRGKKGKVVARYDLKIPTNIPRILELCDVTKLLLNQIERVRLSEAVGRISAEYITPFPPGIPLTMKGDELTNEIIEYYLKLKTYHNVHIAARDKTLETVWVVK